MNLTSDELKLVQLYARMQTGVKPRWPVWFIEIGAPLALTVYGVVVHKPAFLGAAIGGLIVMNANRMFRGVGVRSCNYAFLHRVGRPGSELLDCKT